MSEQDLHEEIKVLRERLQALKYEMDSKLEDRIEQLETEKFTLETAIKCRMENIKPGDVFMIDSEETLQVVNQPLLMNIAKQYGCTIVVAGHLDKIAKLSDVELEKHNLKRLEPGERSTALQKLESILIDVRVTKEQQKWDHVAMGLIEDMETNVNRSVAAFKTFEKLVGEKREAIIRGGVNA